MIGFRKKRYDKFTYGEKPIEIFIDDITSFYVYIYTNVCGRIVKVQRVPSGLSSHAIDDYHKYLFYRNYFAGRHVGDEIIISVEHSDYEQVYQILKEACRSGEVIYFYPKRLK